MKKIKTLKLKEALIIGATLLFSIITLAFSLINGFGRTDKVLSAKADEVTVTSSGESVDVSGLEVKGVEFKFESSYSGGSHPDAFGPDYPTFSYGGGDVVQYLGIDEEGEILLSDSPTPEDGYTFGIKILSGATLPYPDYGMPDSTYSGNVIRNLFLQVLGYRGDEWDDSMLNYDIGEYQYESVGQTYHEYLRENVFDRELDTIVVFYNESHDVVGYSTESRYLTITEIVTYSLPTNPEKEGYVFTGWYTDEACTNAYEYDYVTEETTLYAGWANKQITLTFNYSYGDNSTQRIVYYNDAMPTVVPAREGHNFLGWYFEDGTECIAEEYFFTEDTTLYAQWEIQQFKVTFIVDGNEYATVTVPYGSKFIEVSNATLLTGDVTAYKANSVLTVANETLTTAPDGEAIITNDVVADVTLEVKSLDDKAKDFFGDVKDFFVKAWDWTKEHWVIVLCSFLGAGLLIAVITSLVKSKKF